MVRRRFARPASWKPMAGLGDGEDEVDTWFDNGGTNPVPDFEPDTVSPVIITGSTGNLIDVTPFDPILGPDQVVDAPTLAPPLDLSTFIPDFSFTPTQIANNPLAAALTSLKKALSPKGGGGGGAASSSAAPKPPTLTASKPPLSASGLTANPMLMGGLGLFALVIGAALLSGGHHDHSSGGRRR